MRRIVEWVLLGMIAGELACDSRPPGQATRPVQELESRYAGSASCAECHAEAYSQWKESHHAHGQRGMRSELDRPAFDPPRAIRHGSQTSSVEMRDGPCCITTTGSDGRPRTYEPTGAIGVAPLWQYLIPETGGRWQATELAFDPVKKEWFNVYREEDRRHWEWGHWSQRGMNWNSMCATCHTTFFQKNYDRAGDRYESTYVELGIGCEQCHGPLNSHVVWQRAHPGESGDPTLRALGRDEYLAICGSCHSRRGDLTGRFGPGEALLDHHDPVLPDLTDLYYPDGQVREEDFEYAAFTLSYMHQQQVHCFNCHNAHTGKLHYPGNEMCLQCHQHAVSTKIAIDAEAHGHHPLDKGGSQCVDCHMPVTVYMARHPRHDHGLTIPDPLLTKQYQIPNACNRCHDEPTADWSLQYVERWYGERMERPSRRRAEVLARVKAGETAAGPALLEMLRAEKNAAWRTVGVKFLARMLEGAPAPDAASPALAEVLHLLDDESPLVQAAAIEVLTPFAEQFADRLAPKLESPCRLVRVRSAWALRRTLAPESPAARDLLAQLQFNEDQPVGAFQWGHFYVDKGRPKDSLPWFAKAVGWDGGSAPFRHSYAVVLDELGQTDEAILQVAKAAELDPDEALYPYSLGLLYSEVNRLPEARDALRAAVARDASRSRYWYNLALAESKLGNIEAAIDAMLRAEQLDPNSADYPYARAAICLEHHQVDQAREALRRVLQINPAHPGARELLHAP